MACEHKRLRCTNGVFYCLDCWAMVAMVDSRKPADAATGAKAAASERPKRKTAKKGATKE